MLEDIEGRREAMEKGVQSVFPGIKRLALSIDGECYPQQAGISELIKGMKGIGAAEVLFEGGGDKVLAIKNDYSDIMAVVCYENGIQPSDLSRLIHLMFTAWGKRTHDRPFLPAARVEKLMKRWETRISLVFGEPFAFMIMEKALGGKNRSMLTSDDMEVLRASISSKLGDCLVLEKVIK